MNLEPRQPTRKGPAEWFTGDVYSWLEHVTDEQYDTAATAAQPS